MLVFWNPRGILNKEVELKSFLAGEDAVYAGIAESQTYKQGHALSDGRWRWDAGPEGRPTEKGVGPSRGIGALIDTSRVKASIVRQGKYTIWHRIELVEGSSNAPLAIGTGYFPKAQDVEGHTAANLELATELAYFREAGYQVVFGGDLNAHTGANGDTTRPDKAGAMLLETVRLADMMMVNTMPGKCVGEHTRIQHREDGTQSSTIDYVIVSAELAPNVKSLVFSEHQMGSDHKPLLLTLADLELRVPEPTASHREIWRVKEIPSPPVGGHGSAEDWAWVRANQARFTNWLRDTRLLIEASAAAGSEAQKVGDVLDWSFQLALEEEAAIHIGTKKVGPKATPLLDAADWLYIGPPRRIPQRAWHP
jgi:hypothetical protein